MGWPASIVVGVLTALATMVAAGYVANLAAGWHHMSSFEGKSGYFVVGMALVGLILGLGIGLAARVIREMGGFLRLAQKTGKRLPRLSIDTEVRFRTAAGGRAHRLVALAYPKPLEPHAEAQS